MRHEWFVIINPAAGIWDAKKQWPRISKMLGDAGIRFGHAFTERRGHGIELAKRAVEAGYRKIIAVGGDGIAHEAANGILAQRKIRSTAVKLALIPLGTGNNLSQMIGVNNIRGGIEAIKIGKTLVQDAGIMTYYENRKRKRRYFVLSAGAGYAGFVAAKIDDAKQTGLHGAFIINLLPVLFNIFSYKETRVKLKVGPRRYDADIFCVLIGVHQFEIGIRFFPSAVPDDGMLDVVVIKKASALRRLMLLKGIFDGSFLRQKEVCAYKFKSLHIDSAPQIPVYMDGEPVGLSPSSYGIKPKCVRLIVGEKFLQGSS